MRENISFMARMLAPCTAKKQMAFFGLCAWCCTEIFIGCVFELSALNFYYSNFNGRAVSWVFFPLEFVCKCRVKIEALHVCKIIYEQSGKLNQLKINFLSLISKAESSDKSIIGQVNSVNRASAKGTKFSGIRTALINISQSWTVKRSKQLEDQQLWKKPYSRE